MPATTGTQELIDTFYQEGLTATIGGALRRAQLRVMKAMPTSHPYLGQRSSWLETAPRLC